ncbi:hypothetical protein E2P81_ATG03030 [Venturia nashicola]|nr:hypothetical protein E2P81_ATG03030 [Venturia nashicola]
MRPGAGQPLCCVPSGTGGCMEVTRRKERSQNDRIFDMDRLCCTSTKSLSKFPSLAFAWTIVSTEAAPL